MTQTWFHTVVFDPSPLYNELSYLRGSSMVTKRYGVFIPPFGYVYTGAAWETLKFTPDATKAALGRSFQRMEAALEFIEAIKQQKNEEYKTIQLAVYAVQASVHVEASTNTKESLQTVRAMNHGDKVEEYRTLKEKYDAMSSKEVDDLPTKAWNHYQSLKRTLLLLELI